MACARPSKHSISGGRPGSLSSRMRSWKMGHAVSGSEAPRRARRESEILGGIGMGISEVDCCWERLISARIGLARERAERRLAM